jgi:hypothetical protein
MVGAIKELKDKLLEYMEREVGERGSIERLDKEMVDMVKDLACAEKDCWEAEYYRTVVESMEGGSGYDMEGYGMSGAQGMSGGNRGGNRGNFGGGSRGYRDSRGRYARRGYGMGYQKHIDALKMEMQNADPQEREKMMRELQGMM